MNKISGNTVIVVAIIILMAGLAFADRCPYCGMEYGAIMSGDEGRVYELRKQHEANCRVVQQPSISDNTYKKSPGNNSKSEPQWQQQLLEKQRRLKLQESQAEEIKRSKEESLEKEKFQAAKQNLADSLKDTTSESPEISEKLPLKGLKIKEIPSPSQVKPNIVKPEPQRNSRAFKSSASTGSAVTLVKENFMQAKQSLMGKAKEKLLETYLLPFNPANYIKSLYDQYKEMRREMESLNMNIFQYAMKGISEGIFKLASPSLSDGGIADKYEQGRKNVFDSASDTIQERIKNKIHE